MIRRVLAALCAVALLYATAPEAVAVEITSAGVRQGNVLERARPGWPVPNDPNQLFFLQRSANENTVVYAARFRADGSLDPKNPVQVYWRRYNTDGRVKGLKYIEQRFAFGVSFRRQDDGSFVVWARGLPRHAFLLRPAGPNKAEVFTTIGGTTARPVYVFFNLDESGLIPRVTDYALYGYRADTGAAITEIFDVKGGFIRR